jgi:hypothetical protein
LNKQDILVMKATLAITFQHPLYFNGVVLSS